MRVSRIELGTASSCQTQSKTQNSTTERLEWEVLVKTLPKITKSSNHYFGNVFFKFQWGITLIITSKIIQSSDEGLWAMGTLYGNNILIPISAILRLCDQISGRACPYHIGCPSACSCGFQRCGTGL